MARVKVLFASGACLASILALCAPIVAATPVTAWLERLRDPGHRMDAAYALKYAGMDGQAAVTELLAALKDDDPFVRRYVAAAIGETGFGPERAIPALIAALDDPDADVRSQAAVALGKVGAGSITDLIGLLKGDKREYAVVALADIGVPAVRAVTVGLSDRAWGSEASLILRFMGEPAITELMRMARTTDGSLRRAAVRGLKAIGLPAISKIAEALDLTDPELRRLFAVTIVAIAFNDSDKRLNGVDDPLRTRLRPLIIDALRDRGTDASDRTLIARALAAFPGEAERMVSALMEALGDPSAEVRRAAIVSLGTFKENSAATVKALMRVLARDSDPNVREGAVRALATFGKEAAPAVPLLIAVIRKRSPGASLSWSAARALGAIGADADGAIPVLSDMLADRREAASLRVAGAEALGSMGRKAVPTLIRALALRDEEEYRAVLDALRFAGKDAAPALPRLFEALRSKDYSIGSAAEYVLESIGKPAVPGLLLALEASDEEVRERTAYALGTIGPDAKEAFPALVKIVQDRSAPKRLGEYARRAIASIGSEAIPVLIAASRTDKNGVSLDDLAKALGVYNAKPEDAVRTLVERLRSPGLTEYDKEANVRGLVWCRAGSPEAAQELVKILEAADSPETLREAAVDALIRQGKEASVAGGVLQRILSDPASSATMRERTARALGAMRAASAVPILTALVEDRSAAVGVRQAASWALGRVGEAAGSAALALAEVMRDRTADQDLRGEANDALEGLGQHAAAATSILLETLEDSAQDLSARFGAMRVLDKIGTVPIQTAPALVRLGLMPDDNVDQAMQIVRRMGPEAAPAAVPLLVEGLPMSSPEGVGRILHTLSGLGPRGITALIDATASADAGIRLQALVELSPAASMNPEVFNVLMRALRDADRAVRLQAANTLVALGGQLKEMGPILTTIFNDDYIHRHVPGFAEYERKNVVRKGAKAPPPAPPVRTIEELPVAWEKPPEPSAKDDLPADLLVNTGGTLRDAHQRLMSELRRAGFDEIGLFHAPGGFMLVTKVERIHEDVTPYGGDDRWSKEKIPLRSLSLTEYLKRLFLEKPGQFRFFAFIVSTDVNVETGGAELGEEEARGLVLLGGRGDLPEKIAATPYAGHRCHVLIYQFEKKLGEGVQVLIPSNHSARDHLTKAGLWNNPAIVR